MMLKTLSLHTGKFNFTCKVCIRWLLTFDHSDNELKFFVRKSKTIPTGKPGYIFWPEDEPISVAWVLVGGASVGGTILEGFGNIRRWDLTRKSRSPSVVLQCIVSLALPVSLCSCLWWGELTSLHSLPQLRCSSQVMGPRNGRLNALTPGGKNESSPSYGISARYLDTAT